MHEDSFIDKKCLKDKVSVLVSSMPMTFKSSIHVTLAACQPLDAVVMNSCVVNL